MNEVLNNLKAGARRFHDEVYATRREAYQRIATAPQKPHTLVIACADSRIDPEALMQAGPGEIFVTRNIGNMVPSYGEMLGGVSAVIEYAVTALKVQHIVVCGHSDCGAMKALLHPEATAGMPTVQKWLVNGQAALMVSHTFGNSDDRPSERLNCVTEQNVLMQMIHLKTHPSVAGAMARGVLSLSGWIYDIGSGGVRIAEDGAHGFASLIAAETIASEG